MPVFSILIPAYKSIYLSEAIDSVMSQSFGDFELVIVDDASPNGIGEVCAQYADDRIRYFRNERNCGAVDVVDNWNICLGYAKGDFSICIGDDDRLLPDCLEEYYRLIGKYPDLDVYHAWTEQIDENGQVSNRLEPRPEWESALAMLYYRWCGRPQYIGDFCYRTKSLVENGGFFKLPLAWGSDDVTAFRAALKEGVANSMKPIFQYRISRHTISSSTIDVSLKLVGLSEEKAFVDSVLASIDERSLTPVDRWYRSALVSIEEHTYYRRMAREIDLDIHSGAFAPFGYLRWLVKSKASGLPRKYVFWIMRCNLREFVNKLRP